MEKTAKDKNQSCAKRLARIMLSHVGLMVIVSLYAVVGAYMFINIEAKQQARMNLLKDHINTVIDDSKRYIALDMWYQNGQNHSATKFFTIANQNLMKLHDIVVSGASNMNYDGTNDEIDDWSFSSSLLFTVTTMAAIGYGHVSPKTFNGQVFCIFYGVVGVPLLLVFLANIGDFLARTFRYVYSRGCCVVCRSRRKKSELTKPGKTPDSVFKEVVGTETYMPTDEVQVPITVNVCVVAFYLMFGGLIFKLWEGWEFSEAAYFSFITLSTIGFGDYVPGNSFNMDSGSALKAGLQMLGTIMFSLFGMALLSMCINLIQEQIVAKFKWMAKELGISDEEEDPMLKNKYRKTEGEVTITPPDKDGNKNFRLQNLEDMQHKFKRNKHHGENNKLAFSNLEE